MIHAADRWVPILGEGGHVELGPVSEEEYRIWPHIERKGDRIGAEQVISGDGMVRLAAAVARADGKTPQFSVAAEVVAAARHGDELAEKTLELFTAALGRISGDMALMTLARGDIYLAGGIPPHIESFLLDGPFRASFEVKALHEAIMKTIPTFIIKHPRNRRLKDWRALRARPHASPSI
ncbi:glucokinase [Breoghania sp.]|uniref:glucokinase n=1 Tax=Breoghania sp. TaxID=2065378 RepID=UPI0026087B10|nr:glucokinase [Breoghania sp.]MDJ0929996.1 glucokinase [Breoghania sp.]